MNAQNKTDTIVIPKFTATPIVTVMNIKQVSAKIIVWPAMMLANRRIINANGLVNTPKNSTNGMIGKGRFQVDRRFGPKISFQYTFVANRLTAINVQSANTPVTAIFPVILAPPGKTGMIPIRLLIKIKKNTVSK